MRDIKPNILDWFKSQMQFYGAVNHNKVRGVTVLPAMKKPTFAVTAEKLHLPSKAIYIVIPKTGCTSVKTFFANYYGWMREGGRAVHDPSTPIYQHIFCDDLQQEKYLGYFVFTIVRNPFSRLYSVYKSKIRADGVNLSTDWIDGVALGLHKMGVRKEFSFGEFVDLVCDTPDHRSNSHVKSQWQFVVSTNGKLLVDKYYRFENYQQDFLQVLDKLEIKVNPDQLPHENPTKVEPDEYVKHYTPGMIDRIVRRYKKDFEIFGYPKKL